MYSTNSATTNTTAATSVAAPDNATPATTVVAVAAEYRKLHSSPMQAILASLRAADPSVQLLLFDHHLILSSPVHAWPIAHVLLVVHSPALPLAPLHRYIALRNPLLVNNLHMLPLMQDRRVVRHLLRRAGVPVPPAVYLDRSAGHRAMQTGPNANTLVITHPQTNHSFTIEKPFVEKPVDADDHNVYIYYRDGGVRKLFRKVKNQSSLLDPDQTAVRSSGSYIYEQFFHPQHHSDIKVYAVGPQYFHAEARKAPHIDGIVERDPRGRERRQEVTLTPHETAICTRVASAFDQFVLGFDLLRVGPGRQSFVIDVNGWSLVKNSSDYATRCGAMLAQHVRLRLHERHSVQLQALQLARPTRHLPLQHTPERDPPRKAELLEAERQPQSLCPV